MGKTAGLILKNILYNQKFCRSQFVFDLADIRLCIGEIFPKI